jgi:intermembrane space import and assembly protein 40
MIEEKRRQVAAAAPPPPPKPTKPVEEKLDEAKSEKSQETKPTVTEKAADAAEVPVSADAPEPGSPEALEHEAAQQGAFDPETGEINWGCPCLGGMADGPCGEEFKAAFSCFVYSKDEPKGMDCVDKFQYVFGRQQWQSQTAG